RSAAADDQLYAFPGRHLQPHDAQAPGPPSAALGDAAAAGARLRAADGVLQRVAGQTRGLGRLIGPRREIVGQVLIGFARQLDEVLPLLALHLGLRPTAQADGLD